MRIVLRLHSNPRPLAYLSNRETSRRIASDCHRRSGSACKSSRRILLLSGASFTMLASDRVCAEPELPKDFVSLERKLIKAVKEPIERELEGAGEMEIRKQADKAKEPVREFINKWKLDARVQRTTALTETASALEELGQYYINRGQRAALDRATATSILGHLDAAAASLPAEEESKGFLGGLFGS